MSMMKSVSLADSTHFGRGSSVRIWSGVSCLWRLVGRGSLTWVPRRPCLHMTRPTLLESQKAVHPQVLTFPGGAKFMARHLRHTFLWNVDGACCILMNNRRFWATTRRLDCFKMGLCRTRPFGGACNKYGPDRD